MATLQPVPSTLQIVLKYTTSSSGNLINRIFMTYSGSAPTPTQLNTLAGAIASAWTTDMAPVTDANTELVNVQITDLTSPTSAQGAAASTATGTRSGTQLPAGAAALLNYTISRRYRGGKPRTYLYAGVAGDLSTAQTWTAGFISALHAAWTSFINATAVAVWTGGGTLAQVNVHRYASFENQAYGTPTKYRRIPTPLVPPVTDAITAFAVNPKVASQRRRNEHST